MTDTIRLSIPMLPPRILGQNASRETPTWAKADIRELLRMAVWYAGRDYRDLMLEKATLTITCYIKDRRSIMDTDNALSSLKCAFDMLTARERGKRGLIPGQVGLGIIVDDSPAHLTIVSPINWVVNKEKAPCTEFLIEGE